MHDRCGQHPRLLDFRWLLRATSSTPGCSSALVLVPTRKLAARIAAVLQPLPDVRGRSVATFYGGTNIARDRRRLRVGATSPSRALAGSLIWCDATHQFWSCADSCAR
ncbi:MAG TPA: hypothetical protein VK923_06925 [Euzebyales bacterium]|nr:hypothetical protein [Euzebyales bacterium]